MSFTLNDITKKTADIRIVHDIHGETDYTLDVLPYTDEKVIEALEVYNLTMRSDDLDLLSATEANADLVCVLVTGWPEATNEFFSGKSYDKGMLKKLLMHPAGTFLAKLVINGSMAKENFIVALLSTPAE